MKEVIDNYLRDQKLKDLRQLTSSFLIATMFIFMMVIFPIVANQNKSIFLYFSALLFFSSFVLIMVISRSKELDIKREVITDLFNFDIGKEVKYVNGYVFEKVQDSFLIEECKENKVLIKNKETNSYKEISLDDLLKSYKRI